MIKCIWDCVRYWSQCVLHMTQRVYFACNSRKSLAKVEIKVESVGAARLRHELHTLTHGWTTKDGISAGVFVCTCMVYCEQGKVCCSWLTQEHAPTATRIHPAGVQALENAEFPCRDLSAVDNGRRNFVPLGKKKKTATNGKLCCIFF